MSSKIQWVNAHKTTDGEVFEDRRTAHLHQLKLDFTEWYNNGHRIMGTYEGEDVPIGELLDWLKENEQQLTAFLSEYSDRTEDGKEKDNISWTD
jgi:hypothetical protein